MLTNNRHYQKSINNRISPDVTELNLISAEGYSDFKLIDQLRKNFFSAPKFLDQDLFYRVYWYLCSANLLSCTGGADAHAPALAQAKSNSKKGGINHEN